MMKSKEVVAGDSDNEFDVDEPEEVASEEEWAPAPAVCFSNAVSLRTNLLSILWKFVFRPKNVGDQLKMHLTKRRNQLKLQMMTMTRKKRFYLKKIEDPKLKHQHQPKDAEDQLKQRLKKKRNQKKNQKKMS